MSNGSHQCTSLPRGRAASNGKLGIAPRLISPGATVVPVPTMKPGPAMKAPEHSTAFGTTATAMSTRTPPPTMSTPMSSVRETILSKCSTTVVAKSSAAAHSMVHAPANPPSSVPRTTSGSERMSRLPTPEPRSTPMPPHTSASRPGATTLRTGPAWASSVAANAPATPATPPYATAIALTDAAMSRPLRTAECPPAQRPPR